MGREVVTTEAAVHQLMALAAQYSHGGTPGNEVADRMKEVLVSHSISVSMKQNAPPLVDASKGKLDTVQSEFMVPCPYCEAPVRIQLKSQ